MNKSGKTKFSSGGMGVRDLDIDPAILHYCKYQERCHSEARNKLYELGFTSVGVETQLAALVEKGILNEERFARAFARGKFRMLQWGREKIRQQLKLRKISDYCIRKAMLEIEEAEYENTLNKLSFNKWAESRKDRSLPSRKSKLYRYLLQKGFERDLIMEAINKCIEQA